MIFFFFEFLQWKKFGKHCCKGFWINCDCPPSHEVMDIQKVGIIAKFLFLSYLQWHRPNYYNYVLKKSVEWHTVFIFTFRHG